MNALKRSLHLFTFNVSRNLVISKSIPTCSAIQPRFAPDVISLNVHVGSYRNYSKSKDKGKDKKKNAAAKVEINTAQLANYLDLNSVQNDYEEIFNSMQEEFMANLTVRSSIGAIETVKVHHEGKNYELQELSQIIRKNPKTVILNMTALPQVIPEVLKALANSGLNLNPQQDGTTVFIPIPKVTKEHRENLAKNAKALYNARKLEMRQIPNKCFKKLKIGDRAISEDTMYAVKKQILAMCDNYTDKLKDIYVKKVTELGAKAD